MDTLPPPPPPVEEESLGFVVSHQKLEIEIDFTTQSLTGRTEVTILPQRKDLKHLRFNARQCDISFEGVKVNGIPTSISHEKTYNQISMPERVQWTAEQHEMQKERISPLLSTKPVLGNLRVGIPKSVRIEEVNPFSENAPNAIKERAVNVAVARASSAGVNAAAPVLTPKTGDDAALRFSPLVVLIPFTTRNIRDGLHFVGVEPGDHRYPHIYTRHSLQPGIASCIFPCIDDPAMRNTWDIAIKCGRTLGDALKRRYPHRTRDHHHHHGTYIGSNSNILSAGQDAVNLISEDKNLEMTVVCSADQINEVQDPEDASKKIVSFLCDNQVAARHIGFAVGPFEQLDLSDRRIVADDDKLGQKAVQVFAYCLPRRSTELSNVCETMPQAVDYFSLTFGSYPFSDYKMCFVDDQVPDIEALASLSLCSTRLLFDQEIIDPEVEVTRKLTHALASQWIGVRIVAAARCDMWVVVGISHFIAELFMKQLCGNNEYRFRQKTLADKLVEMDIQRPTLYSLGETLHLGAFEMDFMALKAPLVLFILDRRMTKSSGSTGLVRIISRLFYNASTGIELSDKIVSTESFRRLCEKVGHFKPDSFFSQWVLGSGCPRFSITQRFNKKRLAVEMTITQKQDTLPTQRKLEKDAFLREFKEETNGIYAGEVQSFFTGPMTIRIHEADGTPYEHIVEIREQVQKIEFQYHTKYKRLKRSRREKERATVGAGAEIGADNENDTLLYCLGDVLQSQVEVKEWGLVDWDPELEQKMEQESYEWIRMDADFEWLCELSINMPPYMYLSQLQQDRDVVAQQDSMLYMGKAAPHPLVSTILVRTLMDRRYFHGIRTLAAEYLARHATEECHWIGRIHLEKAFQKFFCHGGAQSMQRANDFSDKKAYLILCAVPRAMAKIRNHNDRCPKEARQFILDQLSFNDNHNNEYSDHFYVANLMRALTDSLLPSKPNQPGEMSFGFGEEDEDELKKFQDLALEEINRYRRMDEWDPSYQNIYTITALESKQRLMKAKFIPTNVLEFFSYAHDDTLDCVRIKAFEAMVDLGFLASDGFLKYFLTAMSTDSSPFVRERLFQVFGLGLAGIAFGENAPEDPAPVHDGLIVEEDDLMDAKKAYIARTTSIEGALSALKEELKDNQALREGLWAAISSENIGLMEQSDLLDICYILYDAVASMVIRMSLPRYWKVENRGKGKLCFKHADKVRTKRMPKVTAKFHVNAAAGPHPSPAHFKSAGSSFTRPPKRPLPPERTISAISERPSKIIKLRGGKALSQFPWFNASSMSRPPSSPSIARPSPSPATQTASETPKPRIPLPTGARVPLPNSAPSLSNKPSLKIKLSIGKGTT
ncbi:MAG: Transcription initiation factor TFIID subunit 2 [Claussenomyces sp. TS43310]|nr:MAG: Transcription initiation factor TFIID subunit 2 [Claussenomyces sp. TS43310]